MKRVHLVNISSAYQTVLPYSCGLLHAYAIQDPQVASAYDFQDYLFHAPDGIAALAERIRNPSVLGLSMLSWNRRRSLKLARLVKEKYPDCLIVVGGPEVPDQALTFLMENPYIDIAVHKEGEITFRNILLENLNSAPDWSALSGVTFRERNKEIHHRPRTHSFLNPISTPSPFLLGLFDAALDYVDRLELPRLTVWETNRGCPFSCTFCDWGSFVNQKLRLVDESKVRAEIDYLSRTFDEIHIADANFGIHPRDLGFAKELSRKMIEFGKLKSVHLTYTKNLNENAIQIAETLESLKPSRAGFTFGVQSLDAGVLRNIKRINIGMDKIEALKTRLEGKGIPTNFEVILGLPGETKKTFLAGLDRCLDLELTDLRTYQLGLYPNSEINNPATLREHEIETELIPIVEGAVDDETEYMETVIATRDLSRDEMRNLKKLVEIIDTLHFGKWTYYLALHARSAHGISLASFYDSLFTHFMGRPGSIVERIVNGWFIREWNSGSWNAFRGPHSPFGIDWKHLFFRKGTFFWLCIAELREEFFCEIAAFLAELGIYGSETADLLRFQNAMIIDFEFDPERGRTLTFDYNWLDHFKSGTALAAGPHTIEFQDRTIGRFKHPIKPRDPESYFYVAGGYHFHFQKIDAFEFSKLKVSYFRDSHEGRFEFQKAGGRQ